MAESAEYEQRAVKRGNSPNPCRQVDLPGMTVAEKAALMSANFACSVDGMVFFDLNLIVRAANESLSRQIGVPLEGILGGPVDKLMAGWWEQIEPIYRQVRDSGNLYPVKTCAYAHKELAEHGDTYWQSSVSPAYGADGSFLGYLLLQREVTECLRHQEEVCRLAAIVESSEDAILGLTLDGIVVNWNPGAERLYGYRADEIIGRSIATVIPPDRMNELGQILARIKDGGRIERFETVRLRKDGGRIDVSLTVSPIKVQAGKTAGISWISHDVTEHKRAEEVMARLAAIVESSDDAIIGKTLEGIITDWNRGAERLYGYSPSEVKGKPISILMPPDRTREIATILDRIKRGERVEHFDTVRVRQDGTRIDVSVSVSPIKDAHGQIIGASTIARDISERKRMEEALVKARDELETRVGERTAALTEANERLREVNQALMVSANQAREHSEMARQRASELEATIGSIAEGVFLCDKEGRIFDVNEAGLRLIGLTTKEEALRPLADYLTLLQLRNPNGRPVTKEELALSRALLGEIVVGCEEIARSLQTQRDIDVLVSAAPIRDREGRITGAVEVVSDITRIRDLDKLKDEFIFVAAHELKTPVAIMKGYAQALLRGNEALFPPNRKILDALNRGADRIDRIVKDLLDVSRLYFAQLELFLERIDLPEMVEETVERAAITTTKHRLRVVRAEPVVVEGDRDRLEQVLMNLLNNAIRYSPKRGDIEVTVTAGEHEAVVSVKDYGVGIPEDKQPQIFERFYRAHTRTPYDYGGMGVGLYISKEIIARHGGRMWFESVESLGSTFSFSVPLHQDQGPV